MELYRHSPIRHHGEVVKQVMHLHGMLFSHAQGQLHLYLYLHFLDQNAVTYNSVSSRPALNSKSDV
jgi:hypothetical protein